MSLLVIIALIGLLPAAIAHNKGHNFWVWWLYGSALFIVALPQSLMMSADAKAIELQQAADGYLRKCPHCAEFIKREATVCRYCHREVEAIVPSYQASSPVLGSKRSDGRVLDSECPSCKALVNQDDASCQACGAVFAG